MKLLLDQNISRRILPQITQQFPDSAHVYLLGLQEADDITIWDYAKKYNYTIVSKDSDFHELCLLNGIPPKIIWLRCGNETNQFLCNLLVNKSAEIEEFLHDKNAFCLEIY